MTKPDERETALRADVKWLEDNGKVYAGRSDILFLLAIIDDERTESATYRSILDAQGEQIGVMSARIGELEGALRGLRCGSCGGSGLYKQKGSSTGYEVERIECATCGGTGQHPLARNALAVDRIEALVHPEGRCADCGGGKPYWRHDVARPGSHAFRPPEGV